MFCQFQTAEFMLTLKAGPHYPVAQNPCTVWVLMPCA